MNTPSLLRDLFEQAVLVKPHERAAFVAASCPDSEMRERLLRMCAADAAEDSEDAISVTDASIVAHVLGEPEFVRNLPSGSRIGPFELIDVLGEGGSSTVFRAVREIEGVRQEVALKLLRRGMYSPDAQRQFRRERIALSQLRHPGIARLIEGGITKEGVAFIALDLVDGMSITDYAREHRLDLGTRLGLFQEVCRAVEAAHRALIVHRDLKPSNVLVTTDGQVKLLDFGIAKMLDSEDETRTELPSFTAAYAAPEQRSGASVTTATDVYALGILLGELVTGERLNDGSGRTPSGQVSDASEPGVLPATPKVTRRQLRGDLDNIVLKAIEAEPGRRYVSAGALADDIDRLRNGQPVAAHPPSAWYRTQKFMLRHRGGVTLTAILTGAVLAALGLALWEAHIARQQALRANTMRDFMVSAFVEAEPSVPREGPPRITEVVENAIAKARADVNMDNNARTELLSQLGDVLRVQGRLKAAGEILRWNYDQSRRNLGDQARLTLDAGEKLLVVQVDAGDYDDARLLADRLLHDAPPAEQAIDVHLWMDSATLATKQDERQRALDEGHRGLLLAKRNGDADLVEYAMDRFGNVQLSTDDVAGAIVTYAEVLAKVEREHGNEHLSTASIQAALSRAYRRNGDIDAAEAHIRKALAVDDALLSKDDWRRGVHLNALMVVQMQQRDFNAALASATETLRIDRLAYEPYEAANELNSVGVINGYLEHHAAAIEPLREAVELSTAKLGADDPQTALQRVNYGTALAYAGKAGLGEAEWRRAVTALENAREPNFTVQAAAYEKFARFRLDYGDATAALPLIDAARALLPKLHNPEWEVRVGILRATALLQKGRVGDAQTEVTAATAALKKRPHPDAVQEVELALLSARSATTLNIENSAQARLLAHAKLMALRNPPSRLLRLDVASQSH